MYESFSLKVTAIVCIILKDIPYKIPPDQNHLLYLEKFLRRSRTTCTLSRVHDAHPFYTLMECSTAWCKNKTCPKNFYRDNREVCEWPQLH